MVNDTLTLMVGGMAHTGWIDVRVVRGVELLPSYFIVKLTERLPGEPKLFPIAPGQKCKVMAGEDTLITGFVDTYQSSIGFEGHEVVVSGRSATQDLVDCAAGVTSGQETKATMTFAASTLLQLAQDLCKPFGITVTAPDGEGKPLVSVADGIPKFTVALGATVWDVLEPQSQLRQMILFDGTDGNLVLAKVGTKKAASGFTLPGNVLDARVRFSKQDRYTIYLPVYNAFDDAHIVTQASGLPSGNFQIPVRDDAAFKGQPRWDGQDRYRPRFVISDQFTSDLQLAELLAKWRMARAYGRSQAVAVTVQGWRDSAGVIWTPNTLAWLDIPALKLQKRSWLITEVSFTKSLRGGTRTMLTLMPQEAFQPEPTLYTPFDPQITQASRSDFTAPPSPPQPPSQPDPASPNPRFGDAAGV